MLKDYSLKILQKALNKALQLDTNITEKLQRFAGKIVEVYIIPLNINFFITFVGNEIELSSKHELPADTIISSSPLGLIRLSLLPISKARSIFNKNMSITGDIELGQDLKKLFDSLEIDWEGHLASFTGDVIAYQVGSIFRRGQNAGRNFKKSMQENLSEYLQHEIRIFPSRLEVEDFYNDINDLVLDTDRLAAHLKKYNENN